MTRDQAGRGRLWGTATAVLLIAGLCGVGAASGGDGEFTDVQSDHTFFNEIELFANAGITGGFPDGTYRPSQPVTRAAMAAFLTRGLSTIDDLPRTDVVQIGASDGTTTVNSLDYRVPGVVSPGNFQYIWVTAAVTWTTETTRAAACINETTTACSFRAQVFVNGSPEPSASNEARVSGDRDGGTIAITHNFESHPGDELEIEVRLIPSAEIADDALHIRGRQLVVTNHPFIDQFDAS
jgi:hypothetical protein